MELKLWKNFKKRINSTKQPADAEATVMDVVFKSNTSIENPILLIEGIDLDYNYCKLGSHYYYINDIVIVNNSIYELHCTQDVLATYKTDIVNSDAYVEYSQSIARNPWIIDTRLQSLSDVVTNTSRHKIINNTSGTYIILTAGSEPTDRLYPAHMGFTNIYAVSSTNATLLSDRFYDTSFSESWKEFFGDDPSKAIVDCHWIPWVEDTTANTIFFGNHDSGIVARGLSNQVNLVGDVFSINIPWIYNDWRDTSPYATMLIQLPFYGTVAIDQNKLIGQSTITCRVIKDAITGEINYMLQSGDWTASYKASTAVGLAVGASNSNKVGAVSSGIASTGAIIGGVIAGVASSGVAAAVAAGVSIVGGVIGVGKSVATAFAEETSGRGGAGGFASARQVLAEADDSIKRDVAITLYTHNYSTTPEGMRLAEGNAVMGWNSLSTLSGFVKCANASINIDGLANDRESVNQWMNQGFYIE